ncbi:MAG TPA: hypothetical protein DCM08_05810 [Microscillaceae bacterium]|nr:hypothetical protein [Microscillaceae bacterium]
MVRFLHEGFDRLYIITNVLDGGTWIQARRKGVPTGTTWSVGEEFVPNSFIYDLVEFQGRLFLAREDGIFYKQQIVALEKPEDTGAVLSIYPNPIAQGRFNMASILPIRQVVIYNLWGQVVWKDEIQQAPYEVRASLGAGMYLLSVLLSDGTTQTRKIVVE